MLTDENQESVEHAPVAAPATASGATAGRGTASIGADTKRRRPLFLRVEWLGQMAASLLWIASCMVVGVESAGDWLQVGAASAWMIANLAALVSSEQ